MFDKLKSYAPRVVLIETLIIVVLCWIVWGSYHADHTSARLPSDGTVSKVTVTPRAPLVGYNKQQLRQKGAISKAVEKDPDAEVLTVGQVLDDSGSRSVAAVLNTETGETQLLEKRPFAEKMSRFELGLGYGLESGDIAKAAQVRATLGRIGPVYFTGQAEYFIVDRLENRHPWNAMGFINVRF